MTTETETPTDTTADDARERIRQSLALASQKVRSDEATLQHSRDARRKVIDLALEGASEGTNPLSYAEVAELTGLSKSAVLKIRTDGGKTKLQEKTE
jgi:DNA invertase Pin-like site-specific DNA recombinase